MINSVDISQSVRELYVGFSLSTPYIVATIKIIDGSMIQDALYKSGVPVSIVYTAGNGSVIREYELVTMGNMGGVKNENNRTGYTVISAISEQYFSLQNEHVSFHQNVTASEVMKRIHKEYDPHNSDLTVTKTKGLIASTDAFHLRGMKLGKAFNIVRSRMTDEKYKSGSYVYYLDQENKYYCVPVEQLFDKATGPTFSQRVAGLSFIREQSSLAHSIISSKKGSIESGYGTDNAAAYQSVTRQRGGVVGKGFDWSSATYSPPSSQDYDLAARASKGKTKWNAPSDSTAASLVSHKFNFDNNQKSNEDFESDVANRNVVKALMMQGAMLINVPLEGGLKSKVGGGCYLDMPSDIGTGQTKTSSHAGQHLIIAQGEYIRNTTDGLMGVAAIQTVSGGQQGDYT
jgi:hypothetical protein